MRALPLLFHLSLTVALSSAALAAPASEKALDPVDVKPRATSFQVLAGALDGSSPTYDRIYGTTVAGNCAAPVSDSMNDGMSFDLFCVEVIDGSAVEIIIDPALTGISDTVLTLYCDPFDPQAPAQNVVAFDDDDGVGTLSAIAASDDVRLVPGREYWVVVSTYGAGMYGGFTVQLGDNVLPCGGVAIEGATWGGVKGLYR